MDLALYGSYKLVDGYLARADPVLEGKIVIIQVYSSADHWHDKALGVSHVYALYTSMLSCCKPRD